jgi:hypothetical protein
MNVEELRLVALGACAKCAGEGTVRSEDWVAFEEWRQRRPTLTPEDEDDLVEQYFLVVCDYDAVPPMGVDCDACEKGPARLEVPVSALLELVFAHVDRPVLAPGEIDELVSEVKRAITAAALSSRGLADGDEVGTWLRAVQEGAQALRSLGELRPRVNDNGRTI